ncbi:hypothetical protein AVEN_135654-1 [Araneus ventricosus]|uniref:Uncharacterized protein n=1 Tax=Araneus ventricosus TaxID=182803 RepID=A0A4Y2EKT5_ARAVE|nr:hypothetical protein AVEN_135654-1 [Araneus ventricosus]
MVRRCQARVTTCRLDFINVPVNINKTHFVDLNIALSFLALTLTLGDTVSDPTILYDSDSTFGYLRQAILKRPVCKATQIEQPLLSASIGETSEPKTGSDNWAF